MANATIEYGLYLEGWRFDGGDQGVLERQAARVAPEEFEPHMAGSIFCPQCFTNITRRPLEKAISRNHKLAFFAHIPTYQHVECKRRVPKGQGENFENEEEAARAIQRGDLVVIAGFIQDFQDARGQALPYAAAAIEDPNGPVTEVSIARHTGEPFRVPARNGVVGGITRNFDHNLKKYYVLPGGTVPLLLANQLHDVANVRAVDDVPKLYYAKIIEVQKHKYRTSILLTHSRAIKDFALSVPIREGEQKGLEAQAVGQYVLMWGIVSHRGEGIGLAIRDPGVGCYALVPRKYTRLLDDLEN